MTPTPTPHRLTLSYAERTAIERSNTERFGSRFGRMVVIATDRGAGRRYRCPCGARVWSVWGSAIRHALVCPQAQGRDE